MKIDLDFIEGNIYGDIVLSAQELDQIQLGEMVNAETSFNSHRIYLGVRKLSYDELSWEN